MWKLVKILFLLCWSHQTFAEIIHAQPGAIIDSKTCNYCDCVITYYGS